GDARKELAELDLLAHGADGDDPMPPAGLMSERQRGLFDAWVKGGFVEQGDPERAVEYEPFEPPELTPVDVENGGRDFLERLQGHWVGDMSLMGSELPWFAWDYRAISPNHVHAIFEGGTLGNLFTSFFAADFRGTRTVMARNGGLLNGIYRTSYFVLDRVSRDGATTEYRLVDAYGGADIMWMSLAFTDDRLEFLSYTSRFGLAGPPSRHMRFTGTRRHPELAEAAAKAVGFPGEGIERRFPDGLPLPDWGAGVPVTSYSYVWEEPGLGVEALGRRSGDPIRIDQMPHLAQLDVAVTRAAGLEETPLEVYLSRDPLTDAEGKLRMRRGFVDPDAFDGILMFSQLTAGEDGMTFTYLHPGRYFLTVVADVNGDGYPSREDVSSRSVEVEIAPQATARAQIRCQDHQQH
ncbi:MAG: hypothetical protein AAFZ87_18530, partial [Planctomycetota bacterium]